MSWRDKLREASFRGVPFHYEETEGEIGRRVVTHEYPRRAAAYHEDLGRKPRGFTIRAFVLGADYMAARDRLIAAIEAEGPGTLVHPYLGSIRVVCTQARQRETTRDGGMATFDLSFEEDTDNRFPEATADTRATVAAAAGVAAKAAKAGFAAKFTTKGQPEFVTAKAADRFKAGLDAFNEPAKRIAAGVKKAADFARAVTSAKTNATSLTRDPLGLAGTAFSLVGSVVDLSGVKAALSVYRELDAFGALLPTPPLTTATQLVVGNNQAALVSLFRRAGAIEAARASATDDYATRDEAVAVRDSLAGRIDGLMLEAGDAGEDDAYASMAALRAALVRDLNARGAGLARIVAVTPAATLPALVIANQLYGDDPDSVVDRAEEIVANNGLRHPGFVPGGEALSVLSVAGGGNG